MSFGEECSCRYTARQALNRVGRSCEFVFTSRSIVSLEAAVVAGMGVMVLPRSRVRDTCLSIWEDAPLPALPDLYCGVFLREGSNWAPLEELADDIAAAVRPQGVSRARGCGGSGADAGGRLRAAFIQAAMLSPSDRAEAGHS